MEAYDNTNRGVLFKNKNKQSEKHPDLTGKIDVGGVEYFLSGWKKKSANGIEFISISVQKAGEFKKESASTQYSESATIGEDKPDDFIF